MEYENVFPKLPTYVRFRLTGIVFVIWFLVWDICRMVLMRLIGVLILAVIMPTFSLKAEEVVMFLGAIQANWLIMVAAAYLSFKITATVIRRHIIPSFLLRPKQG